MKHSPLFVRTYDLLLWLIPQTQKFPRAYRFTVAEHIQRLALAFQDSLVAAGKTRGKTRRRWLQQADIQLEQLRLWVRFARDNRLWSVGQYEHVARMLQEVGRLLGGWLKTIEG